MRSSHFNGIKILIDSMLWKSVLDFRCFYRIWCGKFDNLQFLFVTLTDLLTLKNIICLLRCSHRKVTNNSLVIVVKWHIEVCNKVINGQIDWPVSLRKSNFKCSALLIYLDQIKMLKFIMLLWRSIKAKMRYYL